MKVTGIVPVGPDGCSRSWSWGVTWNDEEVLERGEGRGIAQTPLICNQQTYMNAAMMRLDALGGVCGAPRRAGGGGQNDIKKQTKPARPRPLRLSHGSERLLLAQGSTEHLDRCSERPQ